MGILNFLGAIALRLKGRALAAVVCGGLLAGAGTGTAVLAGNAMAVKATVDSGPTSTSANHKHDGFSHRLANLEGLALKTAAQQLGMTTKQLRQQLASGQSLAQIAGDKAQSVQDAIYSAFKQKLDAAVTAGKLTSAQESKLLTAAQSHLPKLMNRTFGHHANGHHAKPAVSAPASPYANQSSETSTV